MADWRVLGYVPDSEDEKDGPSASPRSALHNAVCRPKTNNVDDHNVWGQNASQSRQNGESGENGTSRTTVEQLEEHLRHGLQTVKEVLADASQHADGEATSDDSPLSSLPSSIASSPLLNPQALNPDPDLISLYSLGLNNDLRKAGQARFASARTFRTRNPIQLHPYMLEDAKYQNLMRDRGLKPVQIPQHASLSVQAQASHESQGTESFAKSQGDETQSFELPSSPDTWLVALHSNDTQTNDNEDLSRSATSDPDDDLPDLGAIMNERESHPAASRRPKVKTIPTRAQNIRQGPSKRQVGRQGDSAAGVDNSSIRLCFSAPPSPPRSVSSHDNTLIEPHAHVGRDSQAVTPKGLPTPAVSSGIAIKRNRLVLSSSDDSSDSSSPSENSTLETKMNTQHKVHNMTKRIHGVLPASWLKLDMKKQSQKISSGRVQSSSRPITNDKGLARRISSKKSDQDTRPHLDFTLESSSSDEDVATKTTSAASHDLLSHTSPIDSFDVYAADVEEDDFVDPMLPPSTSRRSTLGQTKKQRNISDSRAVKSRANTSRSTEISFTNNSNATHPDGSEKMPYRKRKRRRRAHGDARMHITQAPDCAKPRSEQPQFLRIAARHSRGQGSGILTGQKIFQLSSTQDTEDVRRSVQRWRSQHLLTVDMADTARKSVADVALTGSSDAIRPQSPLQAQYCEQTTLTFSTTNPTAIDLSSLKQNTATLLSRITNSRRDATQYSPRSPMATSRAANKPRPIDDIRTRYLQPQPNRSGGGKLLTKLMTARQAQIESASINRPILSRYSAIQHGSRSNHAAQTKILAHTESTTQRADHIAEKLQDLRSEIKTAHRLPKKPKPKKSKPKKSITYNLIETPTIRPSDAYSLDTPRAYDDILKASNTATADEDAVLYPGFSIDLLAGVNAACSPVATSKNDIRSELLSKLVLRRASASLNSQHSGPTTSPVLIIGESVRHYIGAYKCHSKDVVDKCYQSVLAFLDRGDPVDIELFTVLELLIEYVHQSLCFPPYDLVQNHPSSGRLYFIIISVRFSQAIDQYIEAVRKTHDDGRSLRSNNLLKLISLMMLYTFAISTVAQDLTFMASLQGQSWAIELGSAYMVDISTLPRTLCTLCEKFIDHALINIFQLLQTERSHVSDEELSISGISTTKRLILDEQMECASSMFMAWHINQALTKDESSRTFFQQIAQAIARQAGRGSLFHIVQIFQMTKLAASTFFSPFDRGLVTEQHEIHEEAWMMFLPHAQQTLGHIKRYTSPQTAKIYRDIVKSMITFIHTLIEQWKWPITPSIPKVLLEAYSFVDMLPVDYEQDFERIFFNYDIIDAVPELEKNDYDKFVDYVKTAISHSQMSEHEGRNSDVTNRASKLRGLVYSLIPNNAQLYHATKDLEADQFLGLKNHFALFLALYKGSPDGIRPRLQQLQHQVDIVCSHLAVCKLAIKVWEIIACHEVQGQVPNPEAVSEIAGWLRSMVQQGHERFQEGHEDAKAVFQMLLHTLAAAISACQTELCARQLLLPLLEETKAFVDLKNQYGDSVTREALRVLDAYAKKSGLLESPASSLIDQVLRLVRNTLQSVLLAENVSNSLVEATVHCWFTVANSNIQFSNKTWFAFFEPHSSFSIDFLTSHYIDRRCAVAKCIFFSKVLDTTDYDSLVEQRYLLLSTWATLLIRPVFGNEEALETLTTHLIKFSKTFFPLEGISHLVRRWNAQPGAAYRVRFIVAQHLIQTIYSRSMANTLPGPVSWGNGRDSDKVVHDDSDNSFAERDLLALMLSTIKDAWLSLHSDPLAQNDYTAFAQAVVNEMEIYPVKNLRIDRWFIDNTQFPRPSQTIDNLFKCRFDQTAGSGTIAKPAITTFRYKVVESLKFKKQALLASELERVFDCQDVLRVRFCGDGTAQYSVNFQKQADFIKLVVPVYIEAAACDIGALLSLPVLQTLCFLTRNIFFRVDNLNPTHMHHFVEASIACLAATGTAISAEAKLSPATSLLLEYAHLAVDTIWSLMQEIDINPALHEIFATSTIRLASVVLARLTEDVVTINDNDYSQDPALDRLALDRLALDLGISCQILERDTVDILHHQHISLTHEENKIREYARKDLQEGIDSFGGSNGNNGNNHNRFVVDFDSGKVEDRARAFLDLVSSLPLLPDDDDDFDFAYLDQMAL